MIKIKQFTIIKPDDWHVHFRNGKILKTIVKYTSNFYERAMVMPNLSSPIITIKSAKKYKKNILNALKKNSTFTPLMTCYLTIDTDPDDIEYAFYEKIFFAAKLYPKNSTSYSKFGIKKIKTITNVLERMQKIGMPLLVHGEIVDKNMDIFDREKFFIDKILIKLRKDFPELKIVLEHISTKEAVDYIQSVKKNLGATITPHHLMYNRNDMLSNGIRPHLYCLPILKSKTHQEALRKAISSGNKKFFLGTDSAPHYYYNKESHCGSAGIFNSLSSLSIYAEIFEKMHALNHFESFCSRNGALFYSLPENKNTITFIRKSWKIPDKIFVGEKIIIPFLAGKMVKWTIE
ncbi:dihydroorotase [Buchnera aphidicola]|uniref:Dihydroorotase n=1 Tax=Buchnera aphidicola subsp. Melaphis rhois TaxID=118103 RepID=A0A4D6Y141_BUCMH|nr:dihydroorotase [Buchnera aphidicola]QCI23332.1 dihydroorotase [Buchnera aphidicola (Melaphis rhois)]